VATQTVSREFEEATFSKVAWRLIPFLFICYIVAFLDRVNVGFAKLQMSGDLKFDDAIYSLGAGIFFIGYFVFEVPSNVILEKVGAKLWIARIMITWGIISAAFMFVSTPFWFYTLRFLLGVAEAGFFPGIILYLTYWFPGDRRAKVVALFMTAIAMANVIGSPVSGAIMQYMDGYNGWRGWQWLFLLEGLPSVLVGILVLVLLDDGPKKAKWLTETERELIAERIAADNAAKGSHHGKHDLMTAFKDLRVWAFSLVYLAGVTGFYAVNFWMPTIIQELGMKNDEYLKVGLLSMIPWGVAAVAMVLNGMHSDRTGERRWHAAGGLLVAIVGMLILAFVPKHEAAGIAWINSVGNLGGYFGPMLIGQLRAAAKAAGGDGATQAFVALAVLALVGVLITVFMRPAKASAAAVPAAAR
jgi:MFS transporter, ACS family, tartrate transporter